MKSSVILVGLMGAGKSSVGRRLADHWDCPFMDIDQILSNAMGMSISELFTRYGEVFFRDCEEQHLKAIFNQLSPCVLSTGGGAVLRAASRLLMRKSGTVVYLHATVSTLVERLQRTDLRQRPVLGAKEGLSARIESLYRNRDTLYRETAHAIVDTDGLTLKQLVLRIINTVHVEETHASILH